MHCHKVTHAMNGNSSPGGMAYESVTDSEQFASVMDLAGYEA